MLGGVFAKTVRERWLGMAIAGGSMVLFLLFAMAVYRTIDIGIYTGLPEIFRSIAGIPADADVGSLGISVVLGSYGALALVGTVIAMGAASIAGEESNGTLGLLLANPKSRTNVLLSKAASMLALTCVTVAFLWSATIAVAAMLHISITGMYVGALALHLLLNALFFGFLAMFLSAWTGNKGVASGASAGLMVLSYLAVGIFPVVGWGNVAKAFPWYYFSGSEPLLNGINWGNVAVLFAGVVVFAFAAVVGINRRDLKSQSVGVTLLDRLRSHPMTKKIGDRLGGGARVSWIWVKAISEHQALLIVTAYVMVLLGVLIGPLYNLMPQDLMNIVKEMPPALMAALGGGDMSTPEGWYQLEVFGLMAPIAVLVATIASGGRALAGEEERRTMGLLLANPITRSRIVIEKAWAMVVGAFIIGFATFAGVEVGSLIGGLGMSIGNICAASLLVTLLGLVFGAMALALSAATGRVKVAVFGSIGVAVAFYLANAFLPVSAATAGFARWSPFYYYLSSDPLLTGMNWAHGALLVGLSAGLIALAVVLFRRRDLRQTG